MTLYVLHYCFSREFFEFVSILHVAMEFNNGNSEYFLSVMDFSFSFLSLFCLWVFPLLTAFVPTMSLMFTRLS